MSKKPERPPTILFAIAFALVVFGAIYVVGYTEVFKWGDISAVADVLPPPPAVPVVPKLDKVAYDAKMLAITHINAASTTMNAATTTPKGMTLISAGTATTSVYAPGKLWPAKTLYPNAGAILPFKRIVAYYGNFYSKGMGVLGQYPEAEMLTKLKAEVAAWEAADPATPVMPAIDYIAVTAQASAGTDGKYRLRMPDSQIDYALKLAHQLNGIVILDVQVGLSTLQVELPLLQKYLSMPDVHLAIDPEFSMKDGVRPGKEIGTFSSADINYAATYLAGLVKANNLPPKVLIVHRFTEPMVTGTKNIRPLPEVEIVMDMDGWGFAAKKINTYTSVIYPEPVQFTGFKLFYKNDLLPPSTRMLTDAEILKLTPQPMFIQYQ